MQKFDSKRYLIFGAVFYLLINLVQSFLMPLINDEAYYWAWSRHLDWGYFDHPPMVALWIKLGFTLFQNELGVRLFTALAASIGYFVLGRFLRLDNINQFWLYTALFFSMILFQAFGFVTTPDSPLLFFGILYLIFLYQFLQQPKTTTALFLGLSMAMLLYSKYHGILLIVFTLLPISLKLIKNKYFWLSVIFGIICFIPHLWWQWENNFISAEYHLVRRNVHNHFKLSNTTDYLASLLWASSPLLAWFMGKALFKTRYQTDFQKAMLGGFLGIVGFFILVTLKRYIQAQWSLLAFIPLLIITFQYFKNDLKAIKWIKILGFATFVILILGRIYFIIQDVPYKTQYHGWKDFMQRAGEITEGTAVFEKYQYTSLYKFYNFPHKDAENYITIENRKSQYELWNSEENLNHQNITYFSKYHKGTDSLTADSRDQDVFEYRIIKDFQTAINLEISISDSIVKGRNFNFDALIYNSGDFPVKCTRENNFNLHLVMVEYPFSEEIKCHVPANFTDFEIEPEKQKKIRIYGEFCDLSAGNYLAYFGFVNHELPMKKQSNYIEVKID